MEKNMINPKEVKESLSGLLLITSQMGELLPREGKGFLNENMES